ncbi:lysophospholipid acyltransferase family protein [Leptodesmis sichuanensis]|uniref:lysophospholipid acyltransferase family protein n=1 Tax=Leptodesmis sichuanensis TaxID=2906798 RepID=UPI001F1FD678|nr:lysophospholipid acyltransferase family protein [Leptodesmis sichuanensis]UIE38814.1 1-acyl-sn-glycerol-3-phosphate acyltransferase [Leptodesmis sichuanensis A121]
MAQDSLSQVAFSPWLYWSLLPVHRLFLSLYFSQIKIQGLEHLPVNGPVVLAPKHYSRWDPLVLALLSVEPLWFMTNANQFSGIQGWFIRQLGAFPVDLARPQVSSFKYAIDLLKAQKKLVLFPEGGIVRDQPVRALKPGFSRLVLQAESALGGVGIPVVPIALSYAPDPTFRSTVTIHIAPPLYSANYRQDSEKQTAQAFTQALQDALLRGMKGVRVKS